MPSIVLLAAARDRVTMLDIDARLSRRYDAVVIGARCAGAATAMLLARAGLSVLVLDRGKEGTDTLSTHALMRAGVLQLHHWGILERVRGRGTPTVTSTAFHYGEQVVAIQLKPRDGVDGLYAPRRFVIDQLLVDGAREAGAELVYGAVVTGLTRAADGRVTGVIVKNPDGINAIEVAAGIVIGADGMRSTIAELVGAAAYRTARHTTAVVFSYFPGLPPDAYHWYYRVGSSTGVIPTNDGQTCVFVSVPPRRFHDEVRADIPAGHRRVLRECCPEVADRLEGVEPSERYRGFPGLHGYFRQSHGPGWALVGDAAYFKDPLTAHGMTDALVDAEHLARAVAQGSDAALAAYQRARDERASVFFDVTDRIASFEWDLPEIQRLHLSLSEEMKREAAEVLALHRAT
jgi:2-polyprenyl-6-methoxyphenol hydroxylase-like FAD-dependent oxidoreductase